MVLRKHAVRIKLQRQPFKLLLLLIRHQGVVVGRDAMIQELWGDGTQVDFDRSLNFCISQIRTALGDDAAAPKYIETVHREGYRFVGSTAMEESAWEEVPCAPEPIPAPGPAVVVARRRFAVWAGLGLIGVAGVAGVGLPMWRLARRPRAAPSPPVPLTGLAGRLSGPAFSPDGKQVAFAWAREGPPGKGEIHVKLIGSVETLQLTSGETLDEFPRWAPDGKSIFFTREQNQEGELWEVPALGGTPRRIAPLGASPLYGYNLRRPFDLLPSGGFLASIRTPGRGWAIARISANGEAGPKLTSPPPRHSDHNPTVAPDGRSFAFVRSEGGSPKELHVQPLGGGTAAQLVPEARVTSAAWAPDGKGILFCGWVGSVGGIWMVAANGGEPRLVHGASAKVQDITLAAEGNLAAYVEERPRVDLWRASLRDAGEPRPLVVSARQHDSPRFSPDGKKLAFFTNRGAGMQAWIANADGSGAHPLTDGLYPSWSPEGKRLAYLLRNSIRTIAVEGGTARTVWSENGIYLTRPVWSPDGNWIYFESSRGGAIDIWRVPSTADNGPIVQVTKSGAIHPQVYGDFLYYRRRSAGTMRVPMEGGAEERVGPEGTAFAVMPGGLYVLREGELLLVDSRTRAVRSLRHLEKAAGGSAIAVSPDETYVVYAHQANAGHEIMLMRDLDWR